MVHQRLTIDEYSANARLEKRTKYLMFSSFSNPPSNGFKKVKTKVERRSTISANQSGIVKWKSVIIGPHISSQRENISFVLRTNQNDPWWKTCRSFQFSCQNSGFCGYKYPWDTRIRIQSVWWNTGTTKVWVVIVINITNFSYSIKVPFQSHLYQSGATPVAGRGLFVSFPLLIVVFIIVIMIRVDILLLVFLT